MKLRKGAKTEKRIKQHTGRAGADHHRPAKYQQTQKQRFTYRHKSTPRRLDLHPCIGYHPEEGSITKLNPTTSLHPSD